MSEVSAGLDNALAWLKRVAGVDDDYLSRWSTDEWAEWANAMRTNSSEPNPSVPVWMRAHLGQWHRDFSGPFPSVAQLWPTAHNWFAEADTHADFTLTVSEAVGVATPTLDDVRTLWDCATARGFIPLLAVTMIPGQPVGEAVIGEIEAVYVIGPAIDMRPLEDVFDHMIGMTGASSTVTTDNAGELMGHAGLNPRQGDVLRAWEWLYG